MKQWITLWMCCCKILMHMRQCANYRLKFGNNASNIAMQLIAFCKTCNTIIQTIIQNKLNCMQLILSKFYKSVCRKQNPIAFYTIYWFEIPVVEEPELCCIWIRKIHSVVNVIAFRFLQKRKHVILSYCI